MRKTSTPRWWAVWVGVAVWIGAATSFSQDVFQGNVVWLPDASGFVFSKPVAHTDRFSIIHYDLSKHALRVVVVESEATSRWLALSPDGAQIAAVRFVASGKIGLLELLFYDFAGQEQRSAAVPWGLAGSFDLFLGLFWGGVPEKMLISGVSSAPATARQTARTPRLTGIYDTHTNTITSLGPLLALPIAGTPIRPDGQGFLAVGDPPEASAATEGEGETPTLVFITWEGWQYRLATTGTSKVLPPWQNVIHYWEGPVALARWPNTTLRLDTDQRTAVLSKLPTPHAWYAFPNGLTIQFLEAQTTRMKPAEKRAGSTVVAPSVEESRPMFRLEIPPSSTRPQPVSLPPMPRACVLFPAPNQQMVAVRCGAHIRVIDDQGTLLADMPR